MNLIVDVETPAILFLDFEYYGTRNKYLSVVCCSLQFSNSTGTTGKGQSIWLHNNKEAVEYFLKFLTVVNNEGVIFSSYNVVAEASALYSLKDNPLKYTWIDLFIEYRAILNHSHFMYGKHLFDGKVITTFRPKYGESKSSKNGRKPESGLAACCYKMLDVIIDTDEKEVVRDIIIASDTYKIEENKDRITAYCESDIAYLYQIYFKIKSWYRQGCYSSKKYYSAFELPKLEEEMLLRGEYSARTAIMERDGYPIDVDKTRNFSKSVRVILNDLARDINSQFIDKPPFKWVKKNKNFSLCQAVCRAFIVSTPYAAKWEMTRGGLSGKNKDYSLSLDAWVEHFPFAHNYPRENFGAQMVRFLKVKQSLNGFMPKENPKKKDKLFWDAVDDSGFVHPYMNIYGSQSSRSQPSSVAFIPLKAAWMRALISPPKGWAMASIDYKSEEYLLQALESNDQKMIQAYRTGDVYLEFGKDAGAIPKDGTKEKYPELRQQAKSSLLGISYGMMGQSLANKLTNETGRVHTKEDAYRWINLFTSTYKDCSKYKQKFLEEFRKKGFAKLRCGWPMFAENDNDRSVLNWPIQGLGASIMRKAVALAQDDGLKVVFTLHDALYIMYPSFQYNHINKLAHAMKEAVKFFYQGNPNADLMGLDAETWSKDYTSISGTSVNTPLLKRIKVEEIHIDERAVDDYSKFKKYFTNEDEIL